MKTTHILIGLGAVLAGVIVYKFVLKKDTDDEVKSGIISANINTIASRDRGNKCLCSGVQSNDGFGNSVPLYNIACCKKAMA